MKTIKSSKKEGIIRSSIKSSFNSIANNKFFRVMFILILIGFLIYQPLVSADYYIKSKILYSNTMESVYDNKLVKVSLVDNGNVYLVNGNTYTEDEYECVPVISGNSFWFSEEKGILISSMDWGESKNIYYSYFLISFMCWVTIILMLVILSSLFAKVFKSKVYSFLTFLVLVSIMVFDLITMYSLGNILANWEWYSIVCRYLPIVLSSIKFLSLIKYIDWVKVSKTS